MRTYIFHNFCVFDYAGPQINITCLYYLSGLPDMVMSREKKSQDFIKIRDSRLNVYLICCQRKRGNTLEIDEESGIDWINQWEALVICTWHNVFFCGLHGRLFKGANGFSWNFNHPVWAVFVLFFLNLWWKVNRISWNIVISLWASVSIGKYTEKYRANIFDG